MGYPEKLPSLLIFTYGDKAGGHLSASITLGYVKHAPISNNLNDDAKANNPVGSELEKDGRHSATIRLLSLTLMFIQSQHLVSSILFQRTPLQRRIVTQTLYYLTV